MRQGVTVADLLRATTDELGSARLAELRTLLFTAFTDDFTEDDWEHALGGVHVLAVDAGEIVGHAAVVSRTLWVGDRPFPTGYVEGVAIDPSRHGSGLGSRVIADANEVVRTGYEMGGLAASRWSFYGRAGWERWAGPTYVLRGGARLRTPDDDELIMVLRFGPSAAVDLSDPITCDDRSGDVW